jgi:hypothetical protein
MDTMEPNNDTNSPPPPPQIFPRGHYYHLMALEPALFEAVFSAEDTDVLYAGGCGEAAPYPLAQEGEIPVLSVDPGSTAMRAIREHFCGENAVHTVFTDEAVLNAVDPTMPVPIPFVYYNISPSFGPDKSMPVARMEPVLADVARALVKYALVPFSLGGGGRVSASCNHDFFYHHNCSDLRCHIPPIGVKFNPFNPATFDVIAAIEEGCGCVDGPTRLTAIELPSIAALEPGTKIAQLNLLFSNCVFTIPLVRRRGREGEETVAVAETTTTPVVLTRAYPSCEGEGAGARRDDADVDGDD